MDFNQSNSSCETETQAEFVADVKRGLSQTQKQLPSKYFYDQKGSELFDQICDLPEYYPTRTELAILEQFGVEISDALGADVDLVELGSGSGIKTELVLEKSDIQRYIPVEISESHLLQSSNRIAQSFPEIEVIPVCADFTQPVEIPSDETSKPPRRIVFFPGSTIGNFTPTEANRLLKQIRDIAGDQGGLLIGIDLQKDIESLEAAYNDSQDVTAEFNGNILIRLRDELGAELDIEAFEHRAFYDTDFNRIEMHLVSTKDQSIRLADEVFEIAEGESIRTEFSHKYDVDDFSKMCLEHGFKLSQYWVDENEYFGVLFFESC